MKAYCLLNHTLTENQNRELKESFGCKSVEYPEESLKKAWSQISATRELDVDLLESVTEWLSGHEEGDVLVVQGEFGSTFAIVDYAFSAGMVPVHAVTKRVESESATGEKVTRQYVFEHVCFRRYQYYKNICADKKSGYLVN